MELHSITQDQIVVIDNEGLEVPFEMLGGEWAVHWDGRLNRGEVEYTDRRLNETITSLEKYQYLVDAFNVEKARIEAEQAAANAEAERLAAEAEALNATQAENESAA